MEVLFINRERRIHQRQADSDNGLELELVLGRWPVAGGRWPEAALQCTLPTGCVLF